MKGEDLLVIIACSPVSTLNFSSITTSRPSPSKKSISQMGIHQRIVQFNHYVCRQLAIESNRDTNRRRYFSSDHVNMVIKSKIFFKFLDKGNNERNLTVETFVRIESRIFMSNAFFWLELIIHEALLTFREVCWSWASYQHC